MKTDDDLFLASQRLADLGFDTSIRGSGLAAFVFSEGNDRAIEISKDDTGFFIELFEAPHENSVRDFQQDTIEHSVEQAIAWLQRRDSDF